MISIAIGGLSGSTGLVAIRNVTAVQGETVEDVEPFTKPEFASLVKATLVILFSSEISPNGSEELLIIVYSAL